MRVTEAILKSGRERRWVRSTKSVERSFMDGKKREERRMGITLDTMISRCRENRLYYRILDTGENARLLVLERGGRVFGPFFGAEGGLLWTNCAWGDAGAFHGLLAGGEWNVGGDRVWIAPEIQFHVRDRSDPDRSMRIPRATDPGAYRLHESDGAAF
jgi:hypothetical protein